MSDTLSDENGMVSSSIPCSTLTVHAVTSCVLGGPLPRIWLRLFSGAIRFLVDSRVFSSRREPTVICGPHIRSRSYLVIFEGFVTPQSVKDGPYSIDLTES